MSRRIDAEGRSLAAALDQIIDRWRDRGGPGWPEDISGEAALALRFARWVDGDADRLWGVMELLPIAAEDWLYNVGPEVARRGRVEEAQEITRRFAEAWDPENFLADLALALAESGFKEAALRHAQDCVARFPEDAWVCINCSDVALACGDRDLSERWLRRGLDLAGADEFTIEGALERLVPLLRDTGRTEEAEDLATGSRRAVKRV